MPRMARGIAHPRLMRSIPFVFNSRGTVMRGTPTQDLFGEDLYTYEEDPILKDIYCYVEPIQNMEVRLPNQTVITQTHKIVLKGYFPTITNADHFFIEPDEDYNIIEVLHDDTDTMTILTCERVNP